MEEALERRVVAQGLTPPNQRQDPLLRQLMISAVQQSLEKEGNLLSPPAYRQNPLLRQLRQRGEVERPPIVGLNPPKYAQDPLLRQLKEDVVDTFKFDFLSLPRREQESLLHQLEEDLPPPQTAHPKDPLLRQLSGGPDNFLDVLGPPLSQRTNEVRTSAPPSKSSLNFQGLINQLGGVRSSLSGKQKGKGGAVRGGKAASISSGSQARLQTTPGGIDFTQAVRTADGRLCVVREEEVEVLENRPLLACAHTEEEQCHETFVTFFNAATEEQCDETFEKKCQISFRSKAVTEPVRSCRRPLVSVCDGSGPEECRDELETICSTRSVEQSPGVKRPDTRCESVPVSVCGSGCVTREGDEECQDTQVDSLTQVPEEVCDLHPQKSCKPITRLVPSLRPTQECGRVPREVCTLQPGQQRLVKRPLVTEWCLDEDGQDEQGLPEGQNLQMYSALQRL